jgi:hypothetical protein
VENFQNQVNAEEIDVVDSLKVANRYLEEKEDILNDFGESKPNSSHPPKSSNAGGNFLVAQITNNPDLVLEYHHIAQQLLSGCTTQREILEKKVDDLAESVMIASQIYKQFPIPDNAYSLSSLNNAHNSTVTLLEKVKDPKKQLSSIEILIKNMFTALARTFTIEVDRAKKEFVKLYPNDKSTIEEIFNRMFSAVGPESTQLYSDLYDQLKKSLEIK